MKASENHNEKKADAIANTLAEAAREVLAGQVTVVANILADLLTRHPDVSAEEITGFVRTLRGAIGQSGDEYAGIWEGVLPHVFEVTCQMLEREKAQLH